MTDSETIRFSAAERIDMGVGPTCWDRRIGGAVYGDNSHTLPYADEDVECFFVGKPRVAGHACVSTVACYHDRSEAPDSANEIIVRLAKRQQTI